MFAILAVFAFFVVNGPVQAGNNATGKKTLPDIDLSLGVWSSTGSTTWTHDASAFEPLVGNPTSRLDYDGVDSTIVELRAHIHLPRGFKAEIAYGAGDAEDGRFTDQDFLSAKGAEFFDSSVQGEHLYSETTSDLNGDTVRYFDIELDKTMYGSHGAETEAGVSVRYLNWNEKHRAQGLTQTICTAPNRICVPEGFSGFNDRDVILNDARWQALFVGVWAERQINERLGLSGEIFFAPLADLTSDDRHLLRPDLSQSPSFRLTGVGRGVAARVDANYRFTPRLTGSVGFRYWWAEVTNETGGFIVFPASGEPFGATLKRFESERYGLILNLVYALGPAG